MSLRDRVVVLDFDGVVWDSVGEAFEQAWIAWTSVLKLRDASSQPTTPEPENPPPPSGQEVVVHPGASGAADISAELRKALARTAFRQARWQCRDGHDFYLVMFLLAQGRTDVGTMPAAEFRALRDSVARAAEADFFVDRFYASRDRMRTEAFEHWYALQRPYPGVVAQIEMMMAEARGIAVATTKDAASARTLLQRAGISDVSVYGRELSLDKHAHIRAISEQFSTPMSSMAFVDDLLENLLFVADLGVRLVLADWGYNTAEERTRASADGLTVSSVADLASKVGALWK